MGAAGAVVIGGYVNGLGLVRALAARRIPTAVITTQPFDIAHRSRFVAAHETAPGIEERPEGLVELLERRARQWRGWALFPTNDEALFALAQNHDRLASAYRIVAASPEATAYLLDKGRMHAVAQAVGMDVPRCYGPADEETAALPELRFPVVVKPEVCYRFVARFGSKLFVAHDRDELGLAVARVGEAAIPSRVFDLVPGGDERIHAYCTYIDASGEPIAGVTIRKLRQAPPLFGVARIAEIVEDDPAMREASIEILRRMGVRGMAIVEFKADPRDGRSRFIEVNGRSVIYNRLLRRAGLDFVGLAWSEAVDGRPEHARTSVWPGVWIHLHADLLYSILFRRHERLGVAAFLAPYRRPKVHAVWSATDPGPFIGQWSRTAREAASGVLRGTHRDRLADRTRLAEFVADRPGRAANVPTP